MITLTEDRRLSGEELEHEDAEEIRRLGNTLIDKTQGEIRFDLGELQRANSLTIAVLLDWYRTATLQEKPIVFANMSLELRNIVEFSGLTELLFGNEQNSDSA